MQPTKTITTVLAVVALFMAGLAGAAPATAGVHDLPQHYAVPGAHLQPGEWRPTDSFAWGPDSASTVYYVVGDSMAGQVAHPVRLAKPHSRVKPRTKSGTPFALPATGDGEADRWRRAVLSQMVDDEDAGKRVVAVFGSLRGSSVDRRRTLWHLLTNGISVRMVTASPLPTSGTRPGEDFTLASDGIGRWATLKAGRETSTSVLDLRRIVARPVGHGGLYHGVVGDIVVYRAGSHVTVDFADRYLPWHLRTKLL